MNVENNTLVNQKEFTGKIAPAFGMDETTAAHYMRKLREADLLPTIQTAPGKPVTLDFFEAVTAILGILASSTPVDAPDQFNDIASLKCDNTQVSVFTTTPDTTPDASGNIMDETTSFRGEPNMKELSKIFSVPLTGVFLDDLVALLKRWADNEHVKCPTVRASWGAYPYAIIEIPDTPILGVKGGGPTMLLNYGVNAPQVGYTPTSRFSSLRTMPGHLLEGLLSSFKEKTVEITEETQPTKGKRRYG